MDDKLEFAVILNRLLELLRENAGPITATIGGMVLLNIGLDLATKGNEATIVSSAASVAAQYYVTVTALERRGLRSSRGRFGAFFGVNLLTGLGMLVGLVLLVLPGIYLSVRWIAAAACLLGDDSSVGGAIGRSWESTRSSVWPITAVVLVIFVPAGVIGLGLGTVVELAGSTSPGALIVGSAITYVFLFGAFVTSWLAGVAVYSLLSPDRDIAEVFA